MHPVMFSQKPLNSGSPLVGESGAKAVRFGGRKSSGDSVEISALKDLEPRQQLFALEKFLGKLQATVSQDALSELDDAETAKPVMRPVSDNRALLEIDGHPYELVREKVTKKHLAYGPAGEPPVKVKKQHHRWRVSSLATVKKGLLLKKCPKVELVFDVRDEEKTSPPLYKSHSLLATGAQNNNYAGGLWLPELSYFHNGQLVASTNNAPRSAKAERDQVINQAGVLFNDYLAELMSSEQVRKAAPDLPLE
jgi:hypothetical protein